MYNVKVTTPVNSKIKVFGKVYTIPFVLTNLSEQQLEEFKQSISQNVKYLVSPVAPVFEAK
jgi:hypothetical protein